MCVLYAVLCTLYYVQTFYSWIIRHSFTSIYGVTTYETVTLKRPCAHMPGISINHKYNSELERLNKFGSQSGHYLVTEIYRNRPILPPKINQQIKLIMCS